MRHNFLILLAVVFCIQGTVRGEDLFPLGVYWPHSYVDNFGDF